jgi:hypothetical protein
MKERLLLKTRKRLLIILALALLVVYYFMVPDYLEQRREVKAMTYRTNEVAQMLAQIPPSPTDLAERLSEAQSDYTAAQDSFPDLLNTTSIIDTVLKLAAEAEVKAIPIITQPWTIEDIGGQDYAVFRLSVTASGGFAGLADFIEQLETGNPPTLVIESMLLERATDIIEEPAMPPYEVKLEIAVFARPPAADGSEEVEP